MPSLVSRILVPPKKVLAVISRRKKLLTRAKSTSLSFLSASHMSPQDVGAVGKTLVLETRVMYQDTAPMPSTLPAGYLWTKTGSRFLLFGILFRSSTCQSWVF